MRLLPRFREERILREEVALVYQNYFVGIIGYYFATVISSVILHQASGENDIFYWLSVSTIACSIILFRYWRIKDKNTIPKTEATAQVLSLLSLGLIWAVLPIFFFDGGSTIIMVAITGITAGVAAAALTMQSPCLPVFLAYAYTSLPALALGFFLLDDIAYTGMGIATIVYLAVLTHFAINLEKMITHSIELRFENVELIDQLQEAVTETKDANRAKSVFLASASHDLRQPLHAMSLFIQTLNGTELNVYQKNIVGHIESASKASRDMLNTLLDFSKLDAGVIKPKRRAFRVQTLFNKLEQELGASADIKNIVYRTRETTAAAYTDMALLELILRNLITNAIHYTETGGVLIACRKRQDRKLLLEIWDTGIGIPNDQQDNIFKEFMQLNNPERDRQKGFGLGLAIAKGLANTLTIPLTLKSKAGKGSVFRIEVEEAETSVVEDMPEDQPLIQFHGKIVLVIDDDESIRLAMRELLMSWGCECFIAESAEEGLELVNGNVVDLLIVDYRLREGKTGREAIILLREHLREDLPAIIITGDTAADRLREAQQSDAYLLHKPVATTELQKTMNSLLNSVRS